MQPQADAHSRICLNFSRDGLNVYANRQALMDLRDQLTWLIESPPEEHYHCHVLMALENDESRFDGKRPRNAGVVFSDGVDAMSGADFEDGEVVDLSFFVMGENDLDHMQTHQK
jgi:hypothetical protein